MPKSGTEHSWAVAVAPRDASVIDVREVYLDHADFVWRSLARLGVHQDDLTDMTQEVFLIVHRQAPKWRPEGRITTWLYGICRKVAAGYRRRAFRRYEEAVPDAPDTRDVDSIGPDETVATREARARLHAILAAMKPEQRAVFVMFEIDELSCEVIAEQTGIPIGTVFSRLRAARKSFERELARWQAREARRSQ